MESEGVGEKAEAKTEDRLKGLVEGATALRVVLDIAAGRDVGVPNVAALLDRTLEDIDELCGLQMAVANEGRE